MSGVAPAVSNSGAERDRSIDALRGAIIALMALDHVRIFLSSSQFDPVDISQTTPGLFLTRWVTHLCAPGFFFLVGFGTAIFEEQTSRTSAAKFLLFRGFFLIAMEILLFGLAWSFHPGWWWFGVIWGLGLAMMVMAGLIHLPKMALGIVAACFTLLHNSIWPSTTGNQAIDALLYSGGIADLPLAGERLVLYPLLPWLALTMLGYVAARWLQSDSDRSGIRALAAGTAGIGGFLAVRLIGFGAPAAGDWEQTGDWVRSTLSLLNVEKYPPSLQYSLVTLGLCLFLLGFFRRWPSFTGRIARPLIHFGRVPFFFYAVHLFVIHGLALAFAAVLGWPTDYLFWRGFGPNLIPPSGFGFALPGVYAVWLLVLAALLPACRAFGRFKRSQTSFWFKLL